MEYVMYVLAIVGMFTVINLLIFPEKNKIIMEKELEKLHKSKELTVVDDRIISESRIVFNKNECRYYIQEDGKYVLNQEILRKQVFNGKNLISYLNLSCIEIIEPIDYSNLYIHIEGLGNVPGTCLYDLKYNKNKDVSKYEVYDAFNKNKHLDKQASTQDLIKKMKLLISIDCKESQMFHLFDDSVRNKVEKLYYLNNLDKLTSMKHEELELIL